MSARQRTVELRLTQEEAESLFRLANHSIEDALDILDSREEAKAGSRALRKLAEEVSPKDRALKIA